MKSSGDLHELIQSLSGPEKRYLTGTFSKADGKHARLYKAVLKQEVYDEAHLRQQFVEKGLIKQLSVAKSYLYDHILKALQSYHRTRTPSLELRAGLDHVELLWLRNLHHQSWPLLERLRKKALHLEIWPVCLECLEKEMRLVRRSGKAEIRQDLESLFEKHRRVVTLINQEQALRQLYDQIFAMRRKGHYVRDKASGRKLEDLLAHPILQGAPPAAFRLAVLYHYSWLYASQLRGETEEVVRRYQLLLEGWRADPQMARHDQDRYLRAMLGYLDMLIGMPGDRQDAIAELMTEVEGLKLDLPSLEHLRNYYLLHLKLRQFGNNGQVAASLRYLEGREDLEAVLETASGAARMTLLYNLLMLHFLGRKYQAALHYANQLLDEKNEGLRQDVQDFARILLFPIHYELGNHELLESLIRSARRTLSRRERLGDFEAGYFSFFRQLEQAVNTQEESEVLNAFYEHLAGIKAGLLGLEELKIWLKGKKLPINSNKSGN